LPAFWINPHRFAYADEPWAAAHIAVALVALCALRRRRTAGTRVDRLEKARLHRGLTTIGGTPPLLTLERYLFA